MRPIILVYFFLTKTMKIRPLVLNSPVTFVPGSVRCSSACACFSHFSINFYGTCEIGLVFTDKTMACYISIKKDENNKKSIVWGNTSPCTFVSWSTRCCSALCLFFSPRTCRNIHFYAFLLIFFNFSLYNSSKLLFSSYRSQFFTYKCDIRVESSLFQYKLNCM